jgi:hypothetical protein
MSEATHPNNKIKIIILSCKKFESKKNIEQNKNKYTVKKIFDVSE